MEQTWLNTNINLSIKAMSEIFQYAFMQRALFAGIIVGISCSILSNFVVLRKMSFYGDAVAHASLAGVGLGLLFGVDPFISMILFSVLGGLFILFMRGRTKMDFDTLIGIYFSGAVALGVLIIGLLKGVRVDLMQFLFGDILGVSSSDLIISVVLAVFVFSLILYKSRDFIRIAFNEDLAYVSGVNIKRTEVVFIVLVSLVVAVTIKIVGVVLTVALLILPAAIAKNVSSNLKQLFSWSIFFGLFSTIVGIIGSYYFNTATGPSIVTTAVVLFLFTSLFKR